MDSELNLSNKLFVLNHSETDSVILYMFTIQFTLLMLHYPEQVYSTTAYINIYIQKNKNHRILTYIDTRKYYLGPLS